MQAALRMTWLGRLHTNLYYNQPPIIIMKLVRSVCMNICIVPQSYTPEKSVSNSFLLFPNFLTCADTSYLDIVFTTDSRHEGSGFVCNVSCSCSQGNKSSSSCSQDLKRESTPPSAPSTCLCGVRKPSKPGWRILGGIKAQRNEFPWQVLQFIKAFKMKSEKIY